MSERITITQNNKTIGFLDYDTRIEDKWTSLINIKIEDDYQNKGYGTALINYLVEVSRKAGMTYIMGCVLTNDKVKERYRFFTNNGFIIENCEFRSKIETQIANCEKVNNNNCVLMKLIFY